MEKVPDDVMQLYRKILDAADGMEVWHVVLGLSLAAAQISRTHGEDPKIAAANFGELVMRMVEEGDTP